MSVLTLGEILLRLSPPGHQRFVQADRFDVHYGGSEANVAVALSTYGVDSLYVTKLPTHPIGQAAINHLRRYGVRTSSIVRGGERIGTYFLETGASQRGSSVIYDRANSAFSSLSPDELDLDRLAKETTWFHWSGITPALGESARRTVQALCKSVQEADGTISCDLNYRAKLWSEEDAWRVMRPLMEHVDFCIAGRGDPFSVLGMENPQKGPPTVEVEEKAYAQVLQGMKEEFGFQGAAMTLRESWSASTNGWSALYLDDRDCSSPYRSSHYEIDLVDRVGGGDAFSAGLIYGLCEEADSRWAVEFAVAASALKQTMPGDTNLATQEEIERLMNGGESGRVRR